MLRAFEPWHLVIIGGIATVLFGAKRLPDSARSLGQSLRILKSEVGAAQTSADQSGQADKADKAGQPTLAAAAPVAPIAPATPLADAAEPTAQIQTPVSVPAAAAAAAEKQNA
jgi:sec-independent protein translocase protein TatA